jgi:hypothetical protein
MGSARLDLSVGQTTLLAEFLEDTCLLSSAYFSRQAVRFLSNSFEMASSPSTRGICNNVHNAKWRVLPLLHRFSLFFVARKQWVGAFASCCCSQYLKEK